MKDEYIFAVDIGTRTVVGLLCRVADSGSMIVEHYCVEPHPRRAMLDGQIHDVGQVSAVLTRVKETLEEMACCTLSKVAIAAAGRSLTTLKTDAELEFPVTRDINDQNLYDLEVRVLAKAREQMAREQSFLYCVGFSPVAHFLNGMRISNPVGQRGKSIGIEVIATFLPQEVIDSLFNALSKAGLEVDSLTLEPIAAMAVAVPPDLRALNLALLDIGAGTSDIAVSREGTIISYGMVDMAGDEITEAIAQHYLLDFNSAEKVKLAMTRQEEIEFIDVLGNKYREGQAKIVDLIEPVVEKLSMALAQEIKANNGGNSPAALFCVGGGSMTPLLQDYLALHLELPPERIGIRTRANLDNVSFNGESLTGPEAITPLGIALTALKPRGGHIISIWVNDLAVSLCNVQKATVAQALIHSGMELDLLGAGTGSLRIILNGQPKIVSGQIDRTRTILVNDVAASLDTELSPGDRVEIGSQEGEGLPQISLGQISTELQSIQVKVNETDINFPLVQKINGIPANQDTMIQPGDRVEVRPPANIGELAAMMDVDLSQLKIEVGGAPADPSTPITADSIISLTPLPSITSPPSVASNSDMVVVTVNGKHLSLASEEALLMHALAQSEIDYSDATGDLQITLNGVAAEFTSSLKSGDRIEIYWTSE